MDERLKNEIVILFGSGCSRRRIARRLRISRKTVDRVLRAHEEARGGGAQNDPAFPRPKRPRASKLDSFEESIAGWLERYPEISATRLHEELREEGFDGGYTIVREYLNEIRPRRRKTPVVRFETGPGIQGQMDYSSYTIEFLAEGTRTVHAFSYLLGYSRRQYLRFVEDLAFETTCREHVRAFHHLGGVPRTCLYDNMKVVVDRWEDDEPIYNTRFLAFATHYGFRPWACRPRRSQTKGKVERPFRYVEENLLNARTFRSLEHLNRMTSWWLQHRADVRIHRESGQSPLERHREELPFLLPLPASDYVSDRVVYRVVDPEGYIQWECNFYPVPQELIGESIVIRIGEKEILAYGKDLEPCARHPLFPGGSERQKAPAGALHPRSSGSHVLASLRDRFRALGAGGEAFLEGILRTHRYGRKEASKVLRLLETYRPSDLHHAIEHATRFRAFRASQLTRILAARAVPRQVQPDLFNFSGPAVHRALQSNPITPRNTAAYQELFEQDPPSTDDGSTTQDIQ